MKNQTLLLIMMCAVTAATAQASQELNVKLYTVGHLSVDSIDDGDDSSIHTTSNSSRLGISGDYEVQSGLQVIFQYESGIDLTGQGTNDGNGGADSSGQFFTKTRPSFIGVRGALGTVLVGHMPALDQWANDYNLFADQVGDLGNLWEGSGIPGRLDDTIHYASPDFNGFDVAVTLKPEDQDGEDSDHLILKLNYANAGLKVGFAHASIGQGEGLDEHTATALTVGYSFDRFTVGGGFQTESDIAGISGEDRNSFTVGASMTLGEKGTLKAQYAISEGDADDSDATQMAVGYDFAYSDKITLYVAYAQVDNDDAVQFSANGKGHGDKVVPQAGDDPSGFSLGIVVKFDFSLTK